MYPERVGRTFPPIPVGMKIMATLTHIELTCDLCGNANDVHTQTIGLDGKTYEIDLCHKDHAALDRVTADYVAKARKISARRSTRRKTRGAKATSPDAKKVPSPAAEKEPETGRPRPAGQKKPAPEQAARAAGPDRGRGILVYGIFPEDIEVTDGTPGIGDHPGPLRVVRADGLAALISELGPSERLGTPDDRRAYREILDGAATEMPVVPLRFGTVLASAEAVTDELLAARHDEFADALADLDGRAQFVVKGRYAGQAGTREREEATRAVQEAMQQHCVASAAREPALEHDGIHVAFLVDTGQESDVERVIGKLAREWDGRIEFELLGPTAAYAFAESRASQDTASE